MDQSFMRLFGKSTPSKTEEEKASNAGEESQKTINELQCKINDFALKIKVETTEATKFHNLAIQARKRNDINTTKECLKKEQVKKSRIESLKQSQQLLENQLNSIEQFTDIVEVQQMTRKTNDHINNNLKPLITIEDVEGIVDTHGEIQEDLSEIRDAFASLNTSSLVGDIDIDSCLNLLDDEIDEEKHSQIEYPVIERSSHSRFNPPINQSFSLNQSQSIGMMNQHYSNFVTTSTTTSSTSSVNSVTSPITITQKKVTKRQPVSLIDDF